MTDTIIGVLLLIGFAGYLYFEYGKKEE